MTTDAPRLPALLAVAWLAAAPALAQETFRFGYLQRAQDAFYDPHRAYTGLTLRDRHRPVDGARLALRDSRIVARALGVKFELVEKSLAENASARDAVEALARDEGVDAMLLDLPLDDVIALGSAPAGDGPLLFNIRHTDDRLRGESCSPSLWHTLPSRAMLMDALAQFLVKKNWKEVLVLEGEDAESRELSAGFQNAAHKFRLELIDVRPFVLSNDPRVREQNNVALLTGGADHDVVFLADSVGEFGRYVPYNTQRPRPVVGAEGLAVSAWHWTWERHGAPQLNQRFERMAKRRMQDSDYAAWLAVKAVVQAITDSDSRDRDALRAALRADAFRLDTYKSAPGGFRPWDQQLRQALLLHRHNAVIASAPLAGFLHPQNNLDTLGVDRRESHCAMP